MQQIPIFSLVNEKLKQLSTLEQIHPGIAVTTLSNLSIDGRACRKEILNNINSNIEATPEDRTILQNIINLATEDEIPISAGMYRTIKDENGKTKLIVGFHPFREFRPARNAKASQKTHNPDYTIYKDFNPEGFHLGTDDLDDGVVGTHHIKGIPIDLFLNRYPYLPSHILLVPDRKFGYKPQNIDPDRDISILEAMMEICQKSDVGDNMRIAYNHQGAHASVNHLHFHGFQLTPNCTPPIEEHLRDAGNSHTTLDSYIRGAEWFPAHEISSRVPKFIRDTFIQNARGEPLTYNLYMTPKGVACIPRNHQNTPNYVNAMTESGITTGFAFAETAGVLIAPSMDVFNMPEEELITKYNSVKDAMQIRTH